MTPSIVVFTTVIGQTDPLRPVRVYSPTVRYRCFTDNPNLAVLGWEMVFVVPDANPIKQSRRLKILAHETIQDDVDATLWLDAAFDLFVDPVQIVDRWLWRADMMALQHPDRDCIVAEAHELVRLKMVDRVLLDTQISDYRAEGFDPTLPRGITSTGLCLRRHAPRVARFNRFWWREFDEHGHTRDQMSVDYSAWRAGIDVAYLTGHYRDNPYAKWIKTPRPK